MKSHTHTPITHEHEIICSYCGVVLATAIEYPHLHKQSIVINQCMQGNALKNKLTSWDTSHDRYYTEQTIKVFTRLRNIVQKEHLPIDYAHETMRILLARKRGLWSIKWQIITLIQVLNNTNDQRLRNHIRHLKKEYANAKGT